MFFLLGSGPGADDEAPELLVHRLCKFALKTINNDMGYLFDKFLPAFEQEQSEMLAQGQTHQQYAAYMEYVDVLEQHLVKFVAQEGYGGGDAAGFLATLKQQVAEDATNVERQFQKTWESMKCQLGDLSELGADGDEFLEQLREFYRPPTVDDLMQTVLNMTEYETFSHLMRSKVQKVKIMREMQRRKDEMMHGEMGLAHRFIEFATKVLNIDMEPFYEKCMPIFTQDILELEQRGQTLEQYGAFQEFVNLAEGHFNSFIAREGFQDDARGFILELQRLAQKDQERLEAELQKKIAQMQKKAELQQQNAEPVIMVCKPTSLADLINYFTRCAEYETFSAMMRGRVAEAAMLKQLFSSMTADGDVPTSAALTDADGYAGAVGTGPHRPNFAPPTRGAQAGYAQPLPPVASAAGTVQISVMVPEGCAAGAQVMVPTPDGQSMLATVPEGLSPGMMFEASYTPPCPGHEQVSPGSTAAQTLSVTVPEGCFAGSQLTLPTPDGQTLLATVPDGLVPGMTFEVFYEPTPTDPAASLATQTLSVTVPDGCFGGSQLTVPTPDGQALLATVPDGLSPGMNFEVAYTPQR